MKAVLIGSGNVAVHLGKALIAARHEVLQVYSRTQAHAEELASILKAAAIDDLAKLSSAAEIYIISVSDSAISSVVSQFPFRDKLLVHTSGTSDLAILESASSKTGVFYPLQSFSKQRQVNFAEIPIAVEGSTAAIEQVLIELANTVSRKTVVFNSDKRKALHAAAVLACNFTNHLYTLAKDILTENKLDFDLIRPLIAETASKVQSFFPEEVQTGPAVRKDQVIVNKHIGFLENKPDVQELYKLLSQNIINFYQKP